MRGIALAEELKEADILSEKLFAQAALDELRGDERICRDELSRLQNELTIARAAVSAALENLCSGIAEQMEKTLTEDKKLRATLVNIFAAYHATFDRNLGGTIGGKVVWTGVLEELFPLPTEAELETAYDLFISQIK
ncbi:MAG: hypothetical protein WDM70_02005 [Nitrosomonadales bacterium]